MGKRAAEPPAKAPPPQKRRSSKGPETSPSVVPALHPALVELEKYMQHPKMQTFVADIPAEAVAMQGLEEFDLDAYKASMKLCKSYSCVVPVTAIDPLSISQPSFAPSWSQIKKCEDMFWSSQLPRADFEGPGMVPKQQGLFLSICLSQVLCGFFSSFLTAGLNWEYDIHVVAASLTERPAKLEPLDLDAYRLSFWLGVAKALGITGEEDKGLLSHLKRAASSMKVTYMFCRSQEEVEKRKWQLSSKVQVLNETAVLRGFKRILGIVQVKKQLASWNMDSSDKAASW